MAAAFSRASLNLFRPLELGSALYNRSPSLGPAVCQSNPPPAPRKHPATAQNAFVLPARTQGSQCSEGSLLAVSGWRTKREFVTEDAEPKRYFNGGAATSGKRRGSPWNPRTSISSSTNDGATTVLGIPPCADPNAPSAVPANPFEGFCM